MLEYYIWVCKCGVFASNTNQACLLKSSCCQRECPAALLQLNICIWQMISPKVTHVAINTICMFSNACILWESNPQPLLRSTVWTTEMTKWSNATIFPAAPENIWKNPTDAHRRTRVTSAETRIFTADPLDWIHTRHDSYWFLAVLSYSTHKIMIIQPSQNSDSQRGIRSQVRWPHFWFTTTWGRE